MPPSTSSSTTMSAEPRPICGELDDVLSTLVTSTGWVGALPSISRPVSGHRAGSSGVSLGSAVGSADDDELASGRLLVTSAGSQPAQQDGRRERGS